jgi:hypothetical protein
MTVSSDQMLVALRVLAESGERPGFTYIGRPEGEVRHAKELAERARVARRELIAFHQAENAVTGVVPCRPDIRSIPTAPEWATQVPTR